VLLREQEEEARSIPRTTTRRNGDPPRFFTLVRSHLGLCDPWPRTSCTASVVCPSATNRENSLAQVKSNSLQPLGFNSFWGHGATKKLGVTSKQGANLRDAPNESYDTDLCVRVSRFLGLALTSNKVWRCKVY